MCLCVVLGTATTEDGGKTKKKRKEAFFVCVKLCKCFFYANVKVEFFSLSVCLLVAVSSKWWTRQQEM